MRKFARATPHTKKTVANVGKRCQRKPNYITLLSVVTVCLVFMVALYYRPPFFERNTLWNVKKARLRTQVVESNDAKLPSTTLANTTSRKTDPVAAVAVPTATEKTLKQASLSDSSEPIVNTPVSAKNDVQSGATGGPVQISTVKTETNSQNVSSVPEVTAIVPEVAYQNDVVNPTKPLSSPAPVSIDPKSAPISTDPKKKEVGQLGRSENPRSGPWPVDSPTSDNRKITLLYYSGFFGKKKIPPYSETAKACPNNCFVTTDHKYADQADAFIVHARDYVSPVSKYKHKPWVLHCRENPAYSPKMRDSKEMAKFSYETTARLDSDFPFPSWRGVTTEGNGPSTYVKPFSAKRNVPIYASNSNCESVRTEYQKKLMKYVGIDSYGSCLHNKDGLKKIYSKNFHKANADLQKEYKFTLVFMNADCDSWVDTRLLYALDAGSVPIFMGTEDVGRFLPGMEDSIIKVSDFENPKALAAYVKKVAADETLYNKYLAWKHRGPVNYSGTEMEAVQSNMANWYCNICDRIRQDPKAHPGRVKADQCYHRKRKDWLPTPKQYDPDNRASVPVIQDMFGVPRTIIVYMGQGKTSPPTWFEKLSMRPNTKSVWGIYGDKYIARSSSNVDILNVRGTTWTTGRNLLYSHAKSIYRGEDILYFVFFDGDVSPISFRSITPKTNLRTPIRTNESAIDYFERLLRTETPAVATVHMLGRWEFCAPEKYNACSTDTDAVISAIHTDAATLLLPYEHSHDRTSWWYSQAVFIEICEIAFPQSVVNYNSLQIINQEHSAYPRNGKYDLGEMKRDINNYLFSRFEEKCANKLFNRMNSTFILRRTKMNSCLVHPICKLKSDYKEETCAKRPKN